MRKYFYLKEVSSTVFMAGYSQSISGMHPCVCDIRSVFVCVHMQVKNVMQVKNGKRSFTQCIPIHMHKGV